MAAAMPKGRLASVATAATRKDSLMAVSSSDVRSNTEDSYHLPAISEQRPQGRGGRRSPALSALEARRVGPGRLVLETDDRLSHLGIEPFAALVHIGEDGLAHPRIPELLDMVCLLYTSDAADDLTRVDLGGRR